MSILFDHSLIKVSGTSFEFDGHKSTYSVTERSTGRLVGHVARSKGKSSGGVCGAWVYLLVSEPRRSDPAGETWTVAGFTRADAVDHLLSAYSPAGIFTGTLV